MTQPAVWRPAQGDPGGVNKKPAAGADQGAQRPFEKISRPRAGQMVNPSVNLLELGLTSGKFSEIAEVVGQQNDNAEQRRWQNQKRPLGWVRASHRTMATANIPSINRHEKRKAVASPARISRHQDTGLE